MVYMAAWKRSLPGTAGLQLGWAVPQSRDLLCSVLASPRPTGKARAFAHSLCIPPSPMTAAAPVYRQPQAMLRLLLLLASCPGC